MAPREDEPLLTWNRAQCERRTRWQIFRQSPRLVVSVVFVAMMLDLIVMTSIDPLLPDILHRMDIEQQNLSLQLQQSHNTSTTFHNDMNSSAEVGVSVETRIGILVAMKPATEAFANILVGAVVDKFGHMKPMICGFIFNTASTLGFAYAPSFLYLVLARACQAIASSLSIISGLALISNTFRQESERSKAISQAFGGLSLGIVLGYPFGSVTYQFVGRRIPCILLAVLSLIDGLFRMFIDQPEGGQQFEKRPTSYLRLLKDPCIVSALLCNFAPNIALGVCLATGPAWMLNTLHAEQWQIGVVLAIAMVFQITTQTLAGIYSPRYGRWIFCMAGMWLYAIGMLIYPHCTCVWMVTLAEIATRSGFGMIICVISPLLSHLVDIRHDSNYGEVYGLYTASYNLALTAGPLLGGFLLSYISFATLYRSSAGLIFVFSWLSFAFRNPEPRINSKVFQDNRQSHTDSHDKNSYSYLYGSTKGSYR